MLRFCGESISIEAPRFGEGALGQAGSTLRKSLLPEIFSTPPFASSSGREHEGSFGSVCPHVIFLLSHPALPGSGCRLQPPVRTGSPKVKRSEQGVTQSEEMRQVGARLSRCGAITPGPPGSPGTRGWGLNHPLPAPALPEPHWVRGPQTLPRAVGSWMGALYSVRVEERMRAPAHGQGPSCPPSKGPLQFPIMRTSFPGSPGQRGFRRLHQGEVQRKPWPGERFPCAWPSFSASQPEFGGFALRCWEVKPELELLGVEVWGGILSPSPSQSRLLVPTRRRNG